MKRVFSPHFSDAARLQARTAALQDENARLRDELTRAQGVALRLTQDKSDLVNRMNSEAFRLKVQGPCYTNCPVWKPRAGTGNTSPENDE